MLLTEAKRIYGVPSANDYICCSGSQYKADDWIFGFELDENKLRPYWLFIDFVVKVDPDARPITRPAKASSGG